MDFEERLKRIAELTEERAPVRDRLNEIDAELARLMGMVGQQDGPGRRVGGKVAKAQKTAPKGTRGGKRTITCKGCGEQGHQQRTCSKSGKVFVDEGVHGEVRANELSGTEKEKKIKRMLMDKLPHPAVAQECGTSTQVVSFIAKQMQSRGEL